MRVNKVHTRISIHRLPLSTMPVRKGWQTVFSQRFCACGEDCTHGLYVAGDVRHHRGNAHGIHDGGAADAGVHGVHGVRGVVYLNRP